MASVTDPIVVGGGGSIFAPPPVTPQPIGKLSNNASTVATTATLATPVDSVTISAEAKALAANSSSKKTAAA
ncbi:MAG: hypothetical protein JNJ85_13280 [Candidatus Kapabacteria bacterium]|nr:hypothetical protein [Candidatus Kapabacteria bacterium]